jgi:hypothetical protein
MEPRMTDSTDANGLEPSDAPTKRELIAENARLRAALDRIIEAHARRAGATPDDLAARFDLDAAVRAARLPR